MTDEPYDRFTPQDQEDLGKLPPSEVHAFQMRLADVTMRHQINEDDYQARYEEIAADAKKMFAEIKDRLKVFRESGQ